MKQKFTNIFIAITLLCIIQVKAKAQLMGAEQNADGSTSIIFANGTITTNTNGTYTSSGNTLPDVTVYCVQNTNNTYTNTSYNYAGQFYQIPPPMINYTPTGNYYSMYISSTNTSTPLAPTANAPTTPCNGTKINTSTADPHAISNPAYSKTITDLKSTFSSNNESSSLIGVNNANGQAQATPLASGTGNQSGALTTNQNNTTTMAQIHTHPASLYPTPSAGDIYTLANTNKANSAFTTMYVLASDGSQYALVVNNRSQTAAFLTQYPASANTTSDHSSWKNGSLMQADYNQIDHQVNPGGLPGPLDLQSFEESQAYILDKYSTGITMYKADAFGNFKEVHTVKTSGVGGSPVFSKYNCN